jgi:hypothetical protein
VSEGLASLDPQIWNLRSISKHVGEGTHYKIRSFTKYISTIDATIDDDNILPYDQYQEQDGFSAMKVKDYIDYAERACNRAEETNEVTLISGEKRIINSNETVYYLLDFDLPKNLPFLYENFKDKFLMSDLLPGSRSCLMHRVSV